MDEGWSQVDDDDDDEKKTVTGTVPSLRVGGFGVVYDG